MAIDLSDYAKKGHEAVRVFWGKREHARQRQIETGIVDHSERAGVTGGKNMDGFAELIADIVQANGLDHTTIHRLFPEFNGASYADRYNLLCRKLVQEGLYTAASILVSPRRGIDTGEYSELSELTGLRTFVSELAGHIAAEAARS